MEILEVSETKYTEIIATPYHIFGSAAFNDLNDGKCDTVYYLLFKDSKYRLGLIAGTRNNELFSPFSAPFGGFSFLSSDIRMQAIDEALDLLKSWAEEKKFASINITLPPAVYNESFIAKQTNCLFRKSYIIAKFDLNYSFNLDSFDENYTDHIWYNARKNLKIARNSGLTFKMCASDEEKELAYEIIRKNREARGFPLRMTWHQVKKTTRIVPADFFIVNDDLNSPIASAIIFHVNKAIVQVIYWGDLPEFAKFKTMNFLSFKVFEYYKTTDIKIVDIGPSSENSLPNFGLCEFKESIGCFIDPKLTLNRQL
jgi:hypothetical protein